jgi:hypothetical protein
VCGTTRTIRESAPYLFSKEKETKGTYRYREAEVADRETAVGSLYVKKSEVGESPPGQLRVTIEAENMA